MSNSLSPQLLAQLFAQESSDPFLTLLTLTHPSFTTIRLVDNQESVVSRGNTFLPFPMRIRLPPDDGETSRYFNIDFDNVSLELLDEIRSVTDAITLKIEMVLASIPNDVQLVQDDLKLQSLTYNKTRISAKVLLDNFLNVEITSEKYGPLNFPGIF